MAERGVANVVPFEPPDRAVEATPAQRAPLAPVQLPRARRPGWPTLASLAIAAGLAAIGLGAWAAVEQSRSTPDTGTVRELDRAVAVLADATAERYPLRGSVGRLSLVVTSGGAAALALDGLGPAPRGATYQAWVIPEGSVTPVADVTFDASSRAVPLRHTVASGARAGVTLEPSGGSERPSRPMRLVASRP
jgi:Anti-sigma-K factor rskA